MEIYLAAKVTAAWMRARVSRTDERGATAVEYSIVAAFIAAVIVVAVLFLGASTNHSLDCSGKTIAAQSGPVC